MNEPTSCKDSLDTQAILQSSSSYSGTSSFNPIISSVQDYLNQANTKKEIGFADLCLSDKQKLAQMFKKLDDSHKEARKYKKLYEEEAQKNEELIQKYTEQQEIFERESTELKGKYNISLSKLKKLKDKSDVIITRLAEEREKEQQERVSEVSFLREENKRMLERYGALQRDNLKIQRQVEELEINRMSLVLQKKETRELSTQTETEPTLPTEEKEQQTSTIVSTPVKLSETKSIALEKKILDKKTRDLEALLKKLSPEREPKVTQKDTIQKETKYSPTKEDRRKDVSIENSPSISDISNKSPLLDYLATPRKGSKESTHLTTSKKVIDRTVDDSDLLNIVQKSDKIRKESPHKLITNHVNIVFEREASSSFDKDFMLEDPITKQPPKPEKHPEKRNNSYSFSESFITDSDYSDSEDEGEYYDEDSLLNVVKVLEQQQNMRASSSISSSYAVTDSSIEGKNWFE